MSCQKRFVADRNLEPPLDWEPPAKIPRMPTRYMRAYTPGMNAGTGLHGYSLTSTKGLNLPYHPLLPKSALMNSLGYNSGLSSTGTGNILSIHYSLDKCCSLLRIRIVLYSRLSNNIFVFVGQNTYLGNMAAAVQGKGGKGGSPSQAALAGLRLPAELHVVSGASQRVSGTPSGSTPQPKGRDYRQQASNQSSSYLNPSSYGVPNNQIYQVMVYL